MNVASRIEASGAKNKIHLSKDTASLLKPHLIVKRDDLVTLKGKGEQQTYWFNYHHRSSEGSRSSSHEISSTACSDAGFDCPGVWEGTKLDGILGKSKVTSTTERLVSWNVDILKPMLGTIIAKRASAASQLEQISLAAEKEALKHEVQVVINMEKFDSTIASNAFDANATVPKEVESELKSYVAAIASGYPNNPCTLTTNLFYSCTAQY